MLNAAFLPALPLKHSELLSPALEPIFLGLAATNFLLGLATTVGLYSFKPWSRPASLLIIGLAVVSYSMNVYFLDAGLKVASDWLATLLIGAVLSMAYFSPIAERFERR